ncbi:autophagy-related protein 101-like [Vicia villosa]|uniref:autophagy-related protein 101-like n=1 Tax=Vicia villosa TaxID=3911 RepID=UPI00273AD4F6|nr:autophagy-related protein 101-like [Vicia villosa]
MNCEVFQLNELEVEQFEIHEVLRCILHTIMFYRAYGPVRPKDGDMELCDITYVQCGEDEVEKKIEEKIEQFLDWFVKHPIKKSQICLSFYEEKNKKGYWFSNKIERLYFEHWYINLNIAPNSEVDRIREEGELEAIYARREALEVSIRNVLVQIMDFVGKGDHVPPIPNFEDVISFPYEITIPSSSDSAFGMDIIKRMIQTGHPTMLS